MEETELFGLVKNMFSTYAFRSFGRQSKFFTPDVARQLVEIMFASGAFSDQTAKKSVETFNDSMFEALEIGCVEGIRLARELGPGGNPIVVQDTTIGSVGCAGASPEQNDNCAALGTEVAQLIVSSPSAVNVEALDCDDIVDAIFAQHLGVGEQIDRDAFWVRLIDGTRD